MTNNIESIKLKPGLELKVDKYSPYVDFSFQDISSNMTLYITEDGRLSCNKQNAICSFIASVIYVETLYPYNSYYRITVKSVEEL